MGLIHGEVSYFWLVKSRLSVVANDVHINCKYNHTYIHMSAQSLLWQVTVIKHCPACLAGAFKIMIHS